MKIAHFVESFSPLSETFVHNKIASLESAEVQNFIYTPSIIETFRVFHPTILLNKKVQLKDRILYKLIYWFGEKERLKALDLSLFTDSLYQNLKKNPPDIIYAHFGPLG